VLRLNEEHSKYTKDLIDKYASVLKENKEIREESEHKITKLTQEVKNLQSKQKTAYYKLIKPDGTIEIKKFSESEVNESTKVITEIQEEFKQKIEAIENKWSEIHKERVVKIQEEFNRKESDYKKTIDELQKSRTVSVNEKKFGIEAGILTDKNYYGHATMDLWGPVFVGVHGELGQNNNNKMGAGLGLRF
jgi:cell division protein ZapA (FtsZ GTPase activity inhibitor)